ncbi:MAG TPA: 6-phosphofructokinase [Achromobacter sp.]|uniref:6-phosphofructokinase n=1 Tax=Achromobacter sp. TaxID=134375 RepID=UPI000EC8A6C4|nr:6-phosphofructokinase [Achromobacter sp.]HAP28160.1 6-phosphofructokinase [Achromobacter sp.]
MAISTRRMSDVLASTDSGRLYRIEVFLRAEDAGAGCVPHTGLRYIFRTSEGDAVIALDEKRYRLGSGEVLTALTPRRET